MTDEDTRTFVRDSDKLVWDVPDDLARAYEMCEREPVVFEMVRLYAKAHDCTIEEVIHGSTSHSVACAAPRLGLIEISELLDYQESLGVNNEYRR